MISETVLVCEKFVTSESLLAMPFFVSAVKSIIGTVIKLIVNTLDNIGRLVVTELFITTIDIGEDEK